MRDFDSHVPTSREADKKHYSQAPSKWLQEKINRECEAINVNRINIDDSERDISICREILEERKK